MASKTMRCFLAVLSVAVLSGAVFTAAAESAQQVPYESYTYWEGISGSERKAVYNRPMYETAPC